MAGSGYGSEPFLPGEVPANPVVHEGDGAESFRTDGRGMGQGDGKKLGFEAAPEVLSVDNRDQAPHPIIDWENRPLTARGVHGRYPHWAPQWRLEPPRVVALSVQNPEHDDAISFDAVEDLVGETSRDHPAEVAVVRRSPIRLLFEKADRSLYLVPGFVAQASSVGPCRPRPCRRARSPPAVRSRRRV